MKCSRCQHAWETKSEYLYVSCPNCMSKVRNLGVVRPVGRVEDVDDGKRTKFG